MADAAEVVTGAVSGVRRDGKKEDGLPVADVPERNGRVKPVGGKEVSGEAEAFLDGLMRDGQAFSWTGLLSRKMKGIDGDDSREKWLRMQAGRRNDSNGFMG